MDFGVDFNVNTCVNFAWILREFLRRFWLDKTWAFLAIKINAKFTQNPRRQKPCLNPRNPRRRKPCQNPRNPFFQDVKKTPEFCPPLAGPTYVHVVMAF